MKLELLHPEDQLRAPRRGAPVADEAHDRVGKPHPHQRPVAIAEVSHHNTCQPRQHARSELNKHILAELHLTPDQNSLDTAQRVDNNAQRDHTQDGDQDRIAEVVRDPWCCDEEDEVEQATHPDVVVEDRREVSIIDTLRARQRAPKANISELGGDSEKDPQYGERTEVLRHE